MTIVGFFLGPIGRWVLISVASVAFMAWVRHDARAPYADRVAELTTSITHQHENAERDRQLAEKNAAKAEELQNELEKIKSPSGTKLTGDELGRLRVLARSHSR